MSKKKNKLKKRRGQITVAGVTIGKPTKAQKRINSCVKGKVGELELVNFLKERGIPARRGQQYEGSSDSPDVVAGGILRNVHLEVKRVQAGSPYKWLEQAATDADICSTPVVVHRRNGKHWIAILDFRDLLNIIQEAHKDVRDTQ